MNHARARRFRPGMTLAELLLALAILAIVSTAVLSMIQIGGNMNSAINSSTANDLEVESAIARILGEGRTCLSMSVPSGTTAGTTFTLQTQPDANNGNQSYDVTYTCSGGQLLETQYLHGTTTPRFGSATAVLIHNLQSFSVCTKSSGSPQVAIITMTVGTGPPALRTFRVTPRNQ